MKFSLTVNCDNAAFADSVEGYELGRILRDLADKMEAGTGPHPYRGGDYPIRDSNGNRCGVASFSEE